MTPRQETIFSSIPPNTSLVSVWDPWRTFWTDTAPFKEPWHPDFLDSALLPEQEIERIKGKVWCGALGMEVPSCCLERFTQTLTLHLLKLHMFSLLQKLDNPRPSLANPCPPYRSLGWLTNGEGSEISTPKYFNKCVLHALILRHGSTISILPFAK